MLFRSLADINTGTLSSENNFGYKGQSSSNGTHNGETWRDCSNSGFISYNIPTAKSDSISLKVRYWGNETGQRNFDILVNDKVVATEDVSGKWSVSSFQNVEYKVPVNLTKDSDNITVKFVPKSGNYAGGVFRLWVYGHTDINSELNALNTVNEEKMFVTINDTNIVINIVENRGKIKIFNCSGEILYSSTIESSKTIDKNIFHCHKIGRAHV